MWVNGSVDFRKIESFSASMTLYRRRYDKYPETACDDYLPIDQVGSLIRTVIYVIIYSTSRDAHVSVALRYLTATALCATELFRIYLHW